MSEGDQQQSRSPLESGRGRTTIGEGAVTKIAGIAAGEVEGVRMGGTASQAVGGIFGSLTGSQGTSRGVSVDVGKVEAAIDVTMAIEYGGSIPQLAESVRSRVTERVEGLTGLRVTELNVIVNDIVFPEEEASSGEEGGRRGGLVAGSGDEDRPRARRTREVLAGGQREASDDTEPIDAGERTATTTGEEVRVEGEPLREDETEELRTEDDDTRRLRRRDRRRRGG